MTIKKDPNKIKVHFGIPQYYKHYKKKYNKVDSKKYNQIISEFNKEIINLIINESVEYYLPGLNMSVGVRKSKRKPKIMNGKLYNTVPVDWNTTKKLWEEDEEARDKKIIVRFNNSHTSGYVFSIRLIRAGTDYKNRKHYKFKASRNFARSLGKRIKDEDKERYDTYKLY